MKFKVSDAAKKIRSSLTKGGKTCFLSDKTINDNLESLMQLLVNDETELDDFVAQVEPYFKTSNGGAQNDQATFINKWNEEHPAPQPQEKPNEQPANPQNVADPAMAQLLKEMQQKLETMEKERASEKAALALSEKRTALKDAFKAKGINDEEWISSLIGKISVSADTDVEKEVDDLAKLYNKGNVTKSTPIPGTPKPGGGERETPLQIAARMAKERNEQNKL
jgi:hypothetical protein